MKLEMLVTTVGDPKFKAHWLQWRSSMSWESSWFLVDKVKEINFEIWVLKDLFRAQVMFSTCWILSFNDPTVLRIIHFHCIWQLEEAVVTKFQSIGSDLGCCELAWLCTFSKGLCGDIKDFSADKGVLHYVSGNTLWALLGSQRVVFESNHSMR